MNRHSAIVVGVGSTSGLGAALARRFAKEGLRVIVAGRTAARLAAVVAEIREHGGSANAVVTDATREKDVVALLNEVGQRETLDLVAYNVGNKFWPLPRKLGLQRQCVAQVMRELSDRREPHARNLPFKRR